MVNNKEYMKRYYQENKEKITANKEKWKKSNPEKVREEKRRWREKHNEGIKKTFDKWKNKTDYHLKMKKYAEKQRENNKEKIKIQRIAYYKLKQGLIKKRGAVCEFCGISPKTLDLHHVEYKNKEENLILLCRGCHMKAHKGIIDIVKGGGGNEKN